MAEIVFHVEETAEGGFIARALGESIFTEGNDLEELRSAIEDAVRCHFGDEGSRPNSICLCHETSW